MKQTARSPQHPSPVKVIAITGCDGSGKSTLAAGLFARLRREGPAELLYLGNSSGRIAERLRGLPVIGAPFTRYLARKAARVHDGTSKATGSATAVTIYLLSRWRAHKFRRMLALARRGVLVITDRYPQAEAAGFRFDGPGLGTKIAKNRLVRKLAAHERRLYQWMASYVPALVIRLDVDAETAHARKPDHSMTALREKIAVLPQLEFNGARILDLDSRDPAARNLDTALDAARSALEASRP